MEHINSTCAVHNEQLAEKSRVINEITSELEQYHVDFNLLKEELQQVILPKSGKTFQLEIILPTVL